MALGVEGPALLASRGCSGRQWPVGDSSPHLVPVKKDPAGVLAIGYNMGQAAHTSQLARSPEPGSRVWCFIHHVGAPGSGERVLIRAVSWEQAETDDILMRFNEAVC